VLSSTYITDQNKGSYFLKVTCPSLSMACALVLWCWIFFEILKGHHLRFCKNVFPPLEPKLLVMWERISEALQVVCAAHCLASKVLALKSV
jgi:hypothetical protein